MIAKKFVRSRKKTVMLDAIMASTMFRNKYLFTTCLLYATCTIGAPSNNQQVDVGQYLQENYTPPAATARGNNANANAKDSLDMQAGQAFQALGQGQSSGLFSAASNLLNSTKPPAKEQQTPPPTTTISKPKINKNPVSSVLPPPGKPKAGSDSTESFEPIDIPTPHEINQTSFDSLKQNAFPLSPGQIKILRDMLDDTQRASAAEPYDSPPEPVSSSLMVNLSPGSTPPAIRLYRGFVSSLVFVDTTGAPWPIVAYDLGNPSAFNIAWNNKDNLLMVQAQTGYNYGNLAVKLKDLDTPVMLTLVPGQKAVDYRVDLRVMARGPNAKSSYSGSGNLIPAGANPVLLNILDAVPPQGAKPLQIPEETAQAWLYQDKIYLRTEYTLLSPAWVAKLSSADGMNAYELIKTPLVLLSRHGKTVQTKIEGF